MYFNTFVFSLSNSSIVYIYTFFPFTFYYNLVQLSSILYCFKLFINIFVFIKNTLYILNIKCIFVLYLITNYSSSSFSSLLGSSSPRLCSNAFAKFSLTFSSISSSISGFSCKYLFTFSLP